MCTPTRLTSRRVITPPYQRVAAQTPTGEQSYYVGVTPKPAKQPVACVTYPLLPAWGICVG